MRRTSGRRAQFPSSPRAKKMLKKRQDKKKRDKNVQEIENERLICRERDMLRERRFYERVIHK